MKSVVRISRTQILSALRWMLMTPILAAFLSISSIAQSGDSLHATTRPAANLKGRVWLVGTTHVVFLASTFIALNQAWYADFPKSEFHFFNDFHEWNQVDKCGHIWTAYQLSRVSSATWQWAGLNEKKAVLLGSATGLAYQSIIEVLDGYSSEWGFSWTDMTANVIGVTSFAAQQLGWRDQRIQIKFSYSPYNYPTDQQQRTDDLFGTGTQRILKDYNSQTYWASVNLRSFFPNSRLPKWLNLSFGYGAEGMLGGFENKWTDKDGTVITRHDVQRLRQFYFAPDIDLTKIKTKNKLLRSVFFVVNAIKIPAPTISWNSNGTCKVYALYF